MSSFHSLAAAVEAHSLKVKLDADRRRLIFIHDEFNPPEALGDALREVLVAPGIEAFEELAIELRLTNDAASALAVLSEIELPQKVKVLSLFEHSHIEYFDQTELALSGDEPFLRALRRLELQAAKVDLGRLEAPALRELQVRAATSGDALLEALADCELPALEALTLWFGPVRANALSDPASVRALLDSSALPTLKRLGLENTEISDALVTELLGSERLKTLSALSFAFGALTDAGADRLIAGAEKLRHLERLDLRRNRLSAEAVSRLQSAFHERALTDGQRSPEPDGSSGIEHYIPLHSGEDFLFLEELGAPSSPPEDEPVDEELERAMAAAEAKMAGPKRGD